MPSRVTLCPRAPERARGGRSRISASEYQNWLVGSAPAASISPGERHASTASALVDIATSGILLRSCCPSSRVRSRYSTAACIPSASHAVHSSRTSNRGSARRPAATRRIARRCEPQRSHAARNRRVMATEGSAFMAGAAPPTARSPFPGGAGTETCDHHRWVNQRRALSTV